MEDGLRKRIVREENTYKVLETELEFDESGILDMVEKHPERFSPNVILRPLYQEIILPNLAYIGGPAEVAYWLQLKGIFDHHKCDFPILLPRIFALYVNKTLTGKIRKLGIKSKDLFSDEQTLKETYILKNASDDHLLDDEFALMTNLFESVLNKAHAIDQSLKGMVGKEHKQVEKSLLNLQKRLKKAQEARFETSLNQIRSVREKLRPDNKLQERTDNFLNIFINNPEFIHEVINTIDPLDFRFNLIFEDE
jgi:uncharacterized protein YllA (UPF0747 family)